MTEPADTNSAQQAQRDADDMGTPTDADTDPDAQAHLDPSGEPSRDNLGNQSGAS